MQPPWELAHLLVKVRADRDPTLGFFRLFRAP